MVKKKAKKSTKKKAAKKVASKSARKKTTVSKKSVGLGKRDTIAIVIVAAAILLAYLFPILSTAGSVHIDVIEITAPECSNCFDITALSDGFVEQEGVKTDSRRSLVYTSGEAQSLIEKHGITTIPAVIIRSSRIADLPSNEILDISGKVGLFQRSVPYLDLASGETKGIVDMIEVTSTCETCPKAGQVRVQLEGIGVAMTPSETVSELSERGQELILEMGLTFTPAVLVSANIEEYWWIFPQIQDAFIKQGDYYFFRSPLPPYKDLTSQEIKGNVHVTYLLDETCENCFNPVLMKRSFEEFGVYFSEEQNVSVSSTPGKALILKYNITKVPTAIFSNDISEYIPLRETLNNLGTFEEVDQSFVIRNLDGLQAKYNTV